MYSSMWQPSPRQWKEWFNKRQWSQREEKKQRKRKQTWGGGRGMKQWHRERNEWRMETIQCPWKPIRLIWIWDWGLLLSSFASYDLLLALLLQSPISLISFCSSLPDALPHSLYSPSHPSFITAHSHQSRFLSMTDGLCECSSKRSVRSSARVVKSWETSGSHRDMRGIMGRGLRESRWGFWFVGTKCHFGVFVNAWI